MSRGDRYGDRSPVDLRDVGRSNEEGTGRRNWYTVMIETTSDMSVEY
jgi:hypothetical protein